jgi:hypothetical protein
MYMNISPAHRLFKQMLGHANHLIITALVGLDGIERRIITGIPPELHAAWSPKNPVASAQRSRRLVLDMALVRAVDALDIYIRQSRRKPSTIEARSLMANIDASGLSIFGKFCAIENHFTRKDKAVSALVALMIAWRNQSAHAEAEITLSDEYTSCLTKDGAEIAKRFSGLDADLLVSGYRDGRDPVFKEIASFINATHKFIQGVDCSLFSELDPGRYLKDLLYHSLSRGTSEASSTTRKQRIQSVWGRDASDRGQYVQRLLCNCGLSLTMAKDTPAFEFPTDLLARLYCMTPSEVFAWIEPS